MREAAAGLAWLAGRVCLALAGMRPVREDQWYDVLRTAAAALPFDAATPLAQWQLGHSFEERRLGQSIGCSLGSSGLRLAAPDAPGESYSVGIGIVQALGGDR